MKDLVSKILKGMYIQTKDKQIEFTERPSKAKVKKKIFLRLVNTKKDKKNDNS